VAFALQQHIGTASQLQRQEEEDWLQSMQAEADTQAETKPQVRIRIKAPA